MPDHPGELVLGVRQRQQSPRYVDVATRQRERIGLDHVHDVKVVFDVLSGRVTGQAPADGLDVADRGCVIREPHLLGDLLSRFASYLLLLLYRCHGAGRKGDGEHDEEGGDP